MIDIPELKKEREKINKKLDELYRSRSKYNIVIEYETRIRQVMRDLEDVSEICFDGQEDKKDTAKRVIGYLSNRVEESEKLSKSIEEEISLLQQELQRINEKLSAPRSLFDARPMFDNLGDVMYDHIRGGFERMTNKPGTPAQTRNLPWDSSS